MVKDPIAQKMRRYTNLLYKNAEKIKCHLKCETTGNFLEWM